MDRIRAEAPLTIAFHLGALRRHTTSSNNQQPRAAHNDRGASTAHPITSAAQNTSDATPRTSGRAGDTVSICAFNLEVRLTWETRASNVARSSVDSGTASASGPSSWCVIGDLLYTGDGARWCVSVKAAGAADPHGAEIDTTVADSCPDGDDQVTVSPTRAPTSASPSGDAGDTVTTPAAEEWSRAISSTSPSP